MAVLHDGVKVYQGIGTDTVIGIASSSTENEIIVTKLRSVETFKVGDTKALSSWSTKLPLPFSCPVIFNQSSNEFVGICNQSSLARWTYETQDLSKKHFKDVGSDVRSLLTSDELDEPVVIFCNGYVEGLDSVSANKKKTRGRKLLRNEEIMNQWLAKEGQTVNVVLLTSRAEGYQLLMTPIPCEDGGTAVRCSLKKPTEQSTVCDSCVFEDGNMSSLFILWSDGSIWRYHLAAVTQQEDRASHLDGQRILKLSSENNLSKVCIEVVHADFIAVSGITGLDSQTSENLSIWSIPYGTLQGHVTLSTAKESTNKDSGRRHLVYLHKYLISATPDSLTCHFCRCDNGTLAQALGKLSTVQVDDNDQRENLTINWSTDDKEQSISSVEIASTKERTLSMLLGSTKVNKTVLRKDIESLRAHNPSDILDILKKVAEDFQKRKPKKGLPGTTLEIVVIISSLAGSACPEFLSAVLEDANANLILTCLERIKDLPEPFVVKCLELILSFEEGKIPALSRNRGNVRPNVGKLCPLGPKQAWCLNQVLGCPFNTVFLLSSMKKVQFDLILLFLKYLAFLVSKECQWSEGDLPDETLVDWISVTLDAHFTQLILTPEAKDILVSLQSHVQQQLVFYSEVNEVKWFVQAICKTAKKSPKDIKQSRESTYSVEFMEL
ncbi:nucleolar protein 11-like isoform X2 [Apostichopus japonicus]|uniref:nucleolar protein 11-like isoform X2 n=1 Tax=Stichopus japonicus TaxID=307972 RepID=UPI003AB72F86